jgi:hypothetical protein
VQWVRSGHTRGGTGLNGALSALQRSSTILLVPGHRCVRHAAVLTYNIAADECVLFGSNEDGDGAGPAW